MLLLMIAVFVVAVFFSAVFSGSETGLYCLSPIRLRVRAEQGDRRARRLQRVLRDSQTALSFTLLGTNLMNYLATASFALLMATQLGFSESEAEVYTTVIVTLIVLVFGEVVPKDLFRSHPDRLMLSASFILRVADTLLFPVVWVLTRLTTRLIVIFSAKAGMQVPIEPRKEIARLLREEMMSSDHDEVHHEMVDRALSLAETPVHAVMTPRNRVVTIAAGAGRDKLLGVARARNHSLLPVYDRHPHRVVGLAEVHRLLDDDSWRTVGERMTPCLRLDPHEPVASALVRLQRERARMAVVVDQGGDLLGIVTLKDLLEELVGELTAW
ncbi:MAG: CNNM domain-containing protein [Planctomycetota bacterium]